MTWKSNLDKFRTCVKYISLTINDIDKNLLEGYTKHLQNIGNSSRTISNSIRILRIVSNYAHKNKLGNRSEDLHNFQLPKVPKSVKRKLTVQEFLSFAAVSFPIGSFIREAQQTFLLVVYLRGMRIADIIQLEQSFFIDGRLKYSARKTGKTFDIKLLPEALTIVNERLNGEKYLFPFFKWKPDATLSEADNELNRVNHIRSITARINEKLKIIAKRAGIDKPVSTHIARHTFAKMALNKIKDTNITMDLLGHSHMAIHEAYIRDITRAEELDNAVDDIFGNGA